jgi:uncharacterized membrane protein
MDAAVLESDQPKSILDGLSAEERAELLRTASREQYPGGTTIFSYGDPSESMFIITSGRVEIFVQDPIGERIVVATLGAGELFGELSLLDGGPRSASALALEDVVVTEIDRATLWSFLRAKPEVALHIISVLGTRLRATDEILRDRVSRNLNAEVLQELSFAQRCASTVADASGSIPFLLSHIVIFSLWICWNTGVIPNVQPFDPYPFGFLTMAVSLEAIFLSCLVLLSQNVQSGKEKIRDDIEYEVNLKAELEVAELHRKLDHLTSNVLGRLDKLQRHNQPNH